MLFKTPLGDCILAAVLAFYTSLYLEMFNEARWTAMGENVYGLITGTFTFSAAWHVVFLFVVFSALGIVIAHHFHAIIHMMYSHRFLIAGVVFVLCIVFEISGSSIGMWAYVLPGSDSTGAIFGIPRSIRSDEWLVFTPFAFSQSYNDYAPISELIRGTATDVTMVYGQPAWAIVTIFRPFLWGYLLFGSAKGLSFYWIGRILVLFLVTLECTKLYTKNDKLISVIIAIAITFSPIMQWWFSVNGIAELFIFGQGVVLCLYYLLMSKKLKYKILYSAILAECIGGYLFILYPAWQIPLFYLFATLSIFTIVQCTFRRHRDGNQSFRSDILCIICAVATAGILSAICISQSWDTIKAVMGTVYPGARNETGGGSTSMLLNYIPSLLSAIDPGQLQPNVCEASAMVSLFPMSLLLAAWALTKKHDPLLIALLCIEAFFIWFMCFGVPSFISRLTLLFEVPAVRIAIAVGAIDLSILARSWTILNHFKTLKPDRKSTYLAIIIIASLFTFITVGIATTTQPAFNSRLRFAMEALAVFLCVTFILSSILSCDERNRNRLLACFATIVVLNGLCINPVQHNISVLSDNETIKMVEHIVKTDSDALWVADSNIYGQALLVAGAPSASSVSVYPDLERWYILDPDREYENIYNRYEHINISPSNAETTFSLSGLDTIRISLDVNDLEKMHASYWLTSINLSSFNNNHVAFNKIADVNNSIFIYKIEYHE